MKRGYSRREFIQRTIMAAPALLSAGALLSSACNPKNNSGGEDRGQDNAAKEGKAVSRCDDLSGVSEADIEKRKQLGYVEETPIPDSRCGNCQLYIPAREGETCGGCMLFKGPVFQGAYCTYWAPQA